MIVFPVAFDVLLLLLLLWLCCAVVGMPAGLLDPTIIILGLVVAEIVLAPAGDCVYPACPYTVFYEGCKDI